MEKLKEIRIITFLTLLYIVFQLWFSYNSSNEFITPNGLIQLFFIIIFFIGYLLCKSYPINKIFIFILIYQVVLVAILYNFYLDQYGNPLGYNPIDAHYYDQLALNLKSYGLPDLFYQMESQLSMGDYGYPFILQAIYRLSDSNPIALAKLFSIVFHLLSCLYLVKTSKLIFSERKSSRFILILYGLNPFSVFFVTSGLKEPLFALIVILAFYFALKALLSKQKKTYFIALLFILLTGLFRTAYPIFLIFSIVIYTLLNTEGKFKRFKQLGLLIVGCCITFIAFTFVQSEMTQKLNYNFASISESRFGRAVGALDYIVMLIGGAIGPFPSFNFENGNDLGLLQSSGNFIKIFFSYFFIIGVYFIFKLKKKILYIALIFIITNTIILVSLAASLDYRFLYPFMPMYFIILTFGYYNYNYKLPNVLKPKVYLIICLSLILLYNFR